MNGISMPRTKSRPDLPLLVDNEVGHRLRRLRRGRIWSLDQAVAAINEQLKREKSSERMTKRVLGSWERGQRKPQLGSKLAATAAVYGVSGDWLLVGEENDVDSGAGERD